MSTKKLTTLALYAVLSLAVYAIESAIPPLIPIPGIKLGLANIITLILLRRFSLRETALVLLVRILLSALLFGQALSLIYSLVGGILSMFVMFLFNKLMDGKLLFLTGAMGGLSHNLGQLFIAFALTSTPGVLTYLPFLVVSGILTGLFTGFAAAFTNRLLPTR